MNEVLNPTTAKWLMYGAFAYLGFTAARFIVGMLLEYIDDKMGELAALDEVESMNYFPRIRVYPELVKRFVAIHNGRILDMLDLGVEEDSRDHYYYLHITQPGVACSDMLIRVNGDTVALCHHKENRVATALVRKCNQYVHDTTLTRMIVMFATRVMNSEPFTTPVNDGGPIYTSKESED